MLLDIFAKTFFQIKIIEDVEETLTLLITMTLFFMVRVFHAKFYIACFPEEIMWTDLSYEFKQFFSINNL